MDEEAFYYSYDAPAPRASVSREENELVKKAKYKLDQKVYITRGKDVLLPSGNYSYKYTVLARKVYDVVHYSEREGLMYRLKTVQGTLDYGYYGEDNIYATKAEAEKGAKKAFIDYKKQELNRIEGRIRSFRREIVKDTKKFRKYAKEIKEAEEQEKADKEKAEKK